MTVSPLVREVHVSTDRATAFTLFTDHIGQWWPLGTHSVYGEQASVAFEDGALVERAGAETSVWGEVLSWDPPRGFRITWHPGTDPEQATEVEVRFTDVDDAQVRVTLTHTGWERRGDDARAGYAEGWVFVLGRFVEASGKATAQSRFMNG
jgi:hypothetical protein